MTCWWFKCKLCRVYIFKNLSNNQDSISRSTIRRTHSQRGEQSMWELNCPRANLIARFTTLRRFFLFVRHRDRAVTIDLIAPRSQHKLPTTIACSGCVFQRCIWLQLASIATPNNISTTAGYQRVKSRVYRSREIVACTFAKARVADNVYMYIYVYILLCMYISDTRGSTRC